MATNDEIIATNSMKLTRDWNSFKQTKLHLTYMLNLARADERKQTVKEIFSFLDEYADIMEHAGYQGVKRKFLNEEVD